MPKECVFAFSLALGSLNPVNLPQQSRLSINTMLLLLVGMTFMYGQAALCSASDEEERQPALANSQPSWTGISREGSLNIGVEWSRKD